MAPLDKAGAYQALLDDLGNVAAVCEATGSARPTVRRYLSLLKLPKEIRTGIATSSGPARVGLLSALVTAFENPDEVSEVHAKIAGFSAEVAEQIVRRSRGDAERIDDLVDAAIAGEFDRRRCGSSLASCPFVPSEHLESVLRLVSNER